MDPVRAALYTRLAAAAAVTSKLGLGANGIFHRRAPLSTTPPYVILDRMAANDYYLFGAGRYEGQVWLVKAIDGGQDGGDSATTVEDIADAVEVALHDAPLVVAGLNLMWIRRESRIDYDEPDGVARWNHCGGLYRLFVQP